MYPHEKKKIDLEAQHLSLLTIGSEKGPRSPPLSPTQGKEYSIPFATKFAYLSVYFLCNVGLTIYNKAVLGHFPYPWLLTALHTGSASLGCYVLLLRGNFTLSTLSAREHVTLVLFSVLFTVNIAVSNVSLAMVSMPFHQIMRSTTPIFTILIYRLRYNRTYSTKVYLSLIPIVLGVGLATYGDYYFTPTGFILTLLGVILAAIKTVITNRILTGPLSLPPLEILLRLSPLACFQSLTYSLISGELSLFVSSTHFTTRPSPPLLAPFLPTISLPSQNLCLALAGNGILAFGLNVASFATNKHTGALTMTVAGNVKMCLTILIGVAVFGVRVGWEGGVGMGVTLAGAGVYSWVELRSRDRGKK